MELFDSRGHLTDDALKTLSGGGPLTELERLEIAEHLGFCDKCLPHSLEIFSKEALLAPEHSCHDTLRQRIRRRNLRELSSRFATAAAAITIAASLWSFNVFGGLVTGSAALSDSALFAVRQADFIHQMQALDRYVGGGLERFNRLFDLGGRAEPQINPPQSQGGLSS